MFVMQVSLQVKPDQVEAFKAASRENGRHTVQEPGNVRFEFFQQADAPSQFMLLEVYRSSEDMEAHLKSEHFQAWSAATTDMFVSRSGVQLTPLFPEEADLG